jgi:ADP-ribose pyrophosphatase YjhB (NUDIX family)
MLFPQIGIGVVLLRGPEVLLIRRGKPPALGAWSLPGGRQELLEETGLAVGPLRLVGHVDSIHRDAARRIEYHYTILDFAGEYVGGEAVAGSDVTAVAWVRAEAFDAYGLWDEARRIILTARSQSRP